MKKTLLCVLPLMITLLSSCIAKEQAHIAPELIEPAVVRTDFAVVERRSIQNSYVRNAIVSTETLGYGFDIPELLFKQYHVRVGDTVKKGDLLAEADIEAYEEALIKIDEEIANTTDYYNDLNRLAEFDIRIAQAELSELSSGKATNEQMDIARNEIRRCQLVIKHNNETLELELTRLNAEKVNPQYMIDNSRIYSGMDGVVTHIENSQIGYFITPFTKLVYISDDTKLKARLDYDESYINPTAYPEVYGEINGRMYTLKPIPIPQDERIRMMFAGKNIQMDLEFLDIDENVKIGDTVTILLDRSSAEDTLVIPVNSLYKTLGSKYVYVMEGNQKIYRDVEIGVETKSYVEIKSGLSEGERVYVKP